MPTYDLDRRRFLSYFSPVYKFFVFKLVGMKNSLNNSMFDKGKSLIYAYALTVLFLLTPGCKSLFLSNEGKKPEPTETLQEENITLLKSDSVMNAGAQVKRIKVSKNLSRLIIEKENIYPQDDSLCPSSYTAELWNIEFNEARTEDFGENKSTICSAVTNMAAFSTKGERLFWIENFQNSSNFPEEQVVRGMSQEEVVQTFSPIIEELPTPPLYLPWNVTKESNPVSSDNLSPLHTDKTEDSFKTTMQETENNGNDPLQTSTNNSSSLGSSSPAESTDSVESSGGSQDSQSNDPNTLPELFTNEGHTVSTRLLETNPLQTDYSYQKKLAKTFKLKIPEEVKNSTEVWLSSDAQWLVCRQPMSNSLNPPPLNTPSEDSNRDSKEPQSSPQENGEVSQEWLMVPIQETQRVIRFPEPIPLSSDEFPSPPPVEGRIKDILAVSNTEDLVATLVEAKSPTSQSKPIHKIVIWDLHVGKTVDLQKAKKPLKAIELSQISISGSISRQKCKFSASGKLFATINDSTSLSIWQSTNGRQITEIGEHNETITDFDLFPNEMEVAIASVGISPEITIWDIRNGAKLQEFLENTSAPRPISSITIPCDQIIFFVTDDGEVKRCNLSL